MNVVAGNFFEHGITMRTPTVTPAIEGVSVNASAGERIRDTGSYSARNSSKGALIEEAARIFSAVAAGASVGEVHDSVRRGGVLSQRSAHNRQRIWTLIQLRYLTPNTPWLTAALAENATRGVRGAEFVSLLYLLYALRDRLTFDFVTTVLWPKGHRGRPAVSRDDVLDLLKSVTPKQPHIDRWSESTRIKLAGSVLTALRDFGVLVGKQKKTLSHPPLPPSTAEAVVRILIAEGHRGREVVEHPVWRLFMLAPPDVAQVLAALAQRGKIRFEKVGTTVVLETPAAWEGES